MPMMLLVKPVGLMVNLITRRRQFVAVGPTLVTQRDDGVVEREHERTKTTHLSGEPVGSDFACVPLTSFGYA